MTGTTKTGFTYNVSLDVFDDMNVMDALADYMDGKPFAISRVSRLVLGDSQHKALKKHLEGMSPDGIAHPVAFEQEFLDIMMGNPETKK